MRVFLEKVLTCAECLRDELIMVLLAHFGRMVGEPDVQMGLEDKVDQLRHGALATGAPLIGVFALRWQAAVARRCS
jgi:hypothetical protein